MSFFVVDTNVPVVANGKSAQAGPACVVACIDALTAVYQQGITLIDDRLLILHEYMKNLSMEGQPGLGDTFMKWIWSVQANPEFCQQVPVTPLEDDPGNFAEFPPDIRLANFDRSDRKFVAVALCSGATPELLNAVDTDWAENYVALREAGLRIRFLCPQHVGPRR